MDNISFEILDYWYSESMKPHWFNSSPEIDADIKRRFENIWIEAANGKFDQLRSSAKGCLALIILLDQVPLNIFRGTAKSFSTEQQAVHICRHAVEKKLDGELNKDELAFLYMPLMHSENMSDQDLAVSLFEKAGLDANLRFAKHHRDLIKTYGRFPHRNQILGRKSTEAEIQYLNSEHAFTG